MKNSERIRRFLALSQSLPELRHGSAAEWYFRADGQYEYADKQPKAQIAPSKGSPHRLDPAMLCG